MSSPDNDVIDGEEVEEDEDEALTEAGLLALALLAKDEDEDIKAEDAIAAEVALAVAAAIDAFVRVNNSGGTGSYIRTEFCS